MLMVGDAPTIKSQRLRWAHRPPSLLELSRSKLGVHLIQIDFTNRHLVPWIVEIVLKQVKVTLINLTHQMHGQIIKVVRDRVRTLRPMSLTFVKAWNVGQFDLMGRFDRTQDVLHALIETLGPKDLVVGTTIGNELSLIHI